MIDLFEDSMPVDESPVDNTAITTMILYFSEEESAEFKALCKKGMAGQWADKNKANVSDFLLTLLRKTYA